MKQADHDDDGRCKQNLDKFGCCSRQCNAAKNERFFLPEKPDTRTVPANNVNLLMTIAVTANRPCTSNAHSKNELCVLWRLNLKNACVCGPHYTSRLASSSSESVAAVSSTTGAGA